MKFYVKSVSSTELLTFNTDFATVKCYKQTNISLPGEKPGHCNKINVTSKLNLPGRYKFQESYQKFHSHVRGLNEIIVYLVVDFDFGVRNRLY